MLSCCRRWRCRYDAIFAARLMRAMMRCGVMRRWRFRCRRCRAMLPPPLDKMPPPPLSPMRRSDISPLMLMLVLQCADAMLFMPQDDTLMLQRRAECYRLPPCCVPMLLLLTLPPPCCRAALTHDV